ncbi:MAG: outer membrane beta-barrel protein, partial [Pedobacter sp.]|nr:outer membrane beta-barrel protein [Pedobacter sp.]
IKNKTGETHLLDKIKIVRYFPTKKEISIPKSEIIPLANAQSRSENIASYSAKKIDQGVETTIAQTQIITPIKTAPIDNRLEEIKKPITKKVKFPISLAINAGPDFNSTKKVIGGKSSLALGIGISIGLSKRFSVQTGLNYGTKNYSASSYDYTFANPSIRPNIAQVNAICKVLEIPLSASYSILDDSKNKINLNAGLSSYLMLKENYTYKYIAAVRADRLIEVTNSNQHFLSVVDLSATYFIKLKNKKFALGFEPYLKIPLSGIGEGRVPLKSSGISLKLNYELNKKN